MRKSALALKTGASGIFLKSEPPARLLEAIKIVADGGVCVDPKVIQLLAEQLVDRSPRFALVGDEKPLDESERNVLLGILEGFSNRKIGDNLAIAESLVKGIVQRLFTKLGVRTQSQLVRVALEGSLGAAREFVKFGPNELAGVGRSISRKPSHSATPLPAVGQSHD